MLEINEELCIGCGQCVNICPFTCLGLSDEKKAIKLRKRCMECLHCAAICPKNAISVDGQAGCAELEHKKITPETKHEIEKLVLQRRSYRHFLPKAIEPALLERALDLANWAPSAKNEHPVNWLVIESAAVKQEIMDVIVAAVKASGLAKEIVSELEINHNNVVMGENATLLLAYCHDKSINPWQDTAIAMTNLELLLQADGIGTCWAGYLVRFMNNVPELKNKFELPTGCSFYGAMMLGYPRGENYKKIPARPKKAKISWLK